MPRTQLEVIVRPALLSCAIIATVLSGCVAITPEQHSVQTSPNGKNYTDHRLKVISPPYEHFGIKIDTTTGHPFTLSNISGSYSHSKGLSGNLSTLYPKHVNMEPISLPFRGSLVTIWLRPEAQKYLPRPVPGTYHLSIDYTINGRRANHIESIKCSKPFRLVFFEPFAIIPNSGFSRAMQ